MKAIRIHQPGGPEELRLDEIPVPQPGPGQALVKLAASGVNFIDVYHRTGLYKLDLPATLGVEGAGTVEAVGPGVSAVKAGERVAFAMPRGSYAEYIVAPAWQLVPIPPNIGFEAAAAAMLQGMTAHYLLHSTFPVRQGQAILIHAAAGGVGLLVCQMAKQLGAFVIGTASTEEKRQLARDAGADVAVGYGNFVEDVKGNTEGRGVDVVYDSVGKDTFHRSLDCLHPRGMAVLFGQSSGKVDPFDLSILNNKGSLYVSRPSLGHYTQNREELMWRAADILNGTLDYRIDRRYPLAEVAQAHRDLESRRTTGKLVLTV
jgi:NADPH:quinone reductase